MMHRIAPILVTLLFLVSEQSARTDAFDNYINPILMKAPAADGAKELKQLTPDLLAEHNRVLANITASLVVVQTNEGRWSKLLVQAARRKTTDEPPQQIPILLIDRFTTYKEGQDRAIQASRTN